MREIKFRGWNTDYAPKPLMEYFEWNDLHSIERMQDKQIMQFTGLTDKNGREIYEGDILKGGVHKSWIVRWNGLQSEWNINLVVPEHYEVIGNIHENPELI